MTNFKSVTNFVKSTLLLSVMLLTASLASAQTHNDGLEAMQLGEYDKAINAYMALTKAANTDQDAWLSLSSAYLAKGDKDKALAALTSAFEAQPEGGLALVATARKLLLMGQAAEAEKQFERAATKYGRKDVKVLRQIGETYLYYIAPGDKKPNLTRAEQLLKAAYESSTRDYASLMAIGMAYREQSQGGPAAQYYEFAAAQQPKNPFPVFMLAKVYKFAKLPEKFVEFSDKAIAMKPDYTLALRQVAEYYYYFTKPRQWEKARDAYKRLIAQSKETEIEDEMQLANLYFICKNYKECIEQVDRILAKDGAKNYLRRLKGYCAYETNDYPSGLQIMNEYFQKAEPQKIVSNDYLYWGRLKVKAKGDTLDAIDNLKKGMMMDTAGWPINEEIANLYYTKRDYFNAAKYYQANLDSVAKPTATQYYRLGFCHFYTPSSLDSMHYEKAEKAFVKVIELAPDNGKATGYSWAGRSAAKLDPDVISKPELIPQYGRAKGYFEKYIESAAATADKSKIKNDLVRAYEYILSYHYFRKEDDAAKVVIGKLKELDPNNKFANELEQNMLNGGAAPIMPPGTPAPGGGVPK
jgi:tetratricopeptide (TPR) repeat protein